jgi:2-polyprenyl-3-methyl-5-hydroxy-6-metoxy-1,4-benzoquinol methylase
LTGCTTTPPAWHCPVHKAPLTGDSRCPRGNCVSTANSILRFAGDEYAAHFGEQWKRYRLTQLDSYTGHPITRERLARCLGPIKVAGRMVLECGAGAGRFTEILLDMGAHVTSIDLSSAVEANAESFPVSATHRIAQADIMELPFAPRQYDVVLCLGVIQHTPSPEQTIAALYEQVRPGGWLVIDHYERDWKWYTRSAPLVRMVLKRLGTKQSMRITEAMVDALLPVHKYVADKRLLRAAWARISPLMTHYATYPELNDDLQRQWALLDTHDALTDWYKHRRSVSEIRNVLQALGGTNIWSERGGNGVEARAMRPEL